MCVQQHIKSFENFRRSMSGKERDRTEFMFSEETRIPDAVVSERQNAADVLIYLADAYCTQPETLVHALVLLDRFISVATEKNIPENFSLTPISVACFMISVKLLEAHHLCLRDLNTITAIQCTDLANTEKTVLSYLNWNTLCISGL